MQDERDLLQLDHSCEAISWTLLNDPDVELDYFAESPVSRARPRRTQVNHRHNC